MDSSSTTDGIDMLSEVEKQFLLKVARDSLSAAVHHTNALLPKPLTRLLMEPCGAFVTLHNRDELRGCIGYVDAIRPLMETVQRAARKAGTEDFRFDPIHPDELQSIVIEISVLSPIKNMNDFHEIEIGKNGILIEAGHRRGLLLPQVAVQHDWNQELFLNHTAEKAGLPCDIWRSQDVKVYTFTTEMFRECPSQESIS